jgi:ATP-dependent exoDNAse (exonuclease V) beta subunit
LEMNIQVGAGGKMGQQSFILDRHDDHLELLRIKNRYLPFSERLSEIRRREYIKSFSSELNNMYVGLTRAQKEMYVFIPARVDTSFNFANLLIPEDALETGSPQAPKEEKAKHAHGMRPLPVSQHHDWLDFLKEEFQDTGQVENRGQIQRGEVLHFILSLVGNLSGQDQKEVLSEALVKARGEYPHIKNWEEYETVARKALSGKALKDFFFVGDGEVYQEKDVVTAKGETRRLDRLIVKKDEVWVVDYKSSVDDSIEGDGQTRGPDAALARSTGKWRPEGSSLGSGAYQDQVREYMAIKDAIYPGKSVKGFLVYLDTLTVEEVRRQ